MKVWKDQLNTPCADRWRLASDQQPPGCQSRKWIGHQPSGVIRTSLSRPHESRLLSPQNLTFYQCFALLAPNWISFGLAILKRINRNQSLSCRPSGLAGGPRFQIRTLSMLLNVLVRFQEPIPLALVLTPRLTRPSISQCFSMFWFLRSL